MPRGRKNANGEGSKARRRKDGRYETRAVLDTPLGRKRVSFYGKTAKEANDQKIEAWPTRIGASFSRTRRD